MADLWDELRRFEKDNPSILDALQTLGVTREEYLKAVNSLHPKVVISSTTTTPIVPSPTRSLEG